MQNTKYPSSHRHARAVPLTTDRARQLRREQTDTESKLWQRLRAGRLNGIKFRRQFPIGQFIADFCCNDYSLVIELDGGQHAEPGGILKDDRRTKIIEQYAYRVIRFWDNEVLTNIEGVLEAIIEATRGGT